MLMKKEQLGKIIIYRRVKKGEHSVQFSLAPQKPKARDIERVIFLAEMGGSACATLQCDSKRASLIWGKDKVLVIQLRFLKDCRRQL
jgi:hypothetical protein